MEQHILSQSLVQEYGENLFEEEKSKATIDKYLRDVRKFYEFLPEGKEVNKAAVIKYKREMEEHYKASSINSMLIALNGFFSYVKWEECRVKLIKIQKSSFRNSKEEMGQDEYIRLIKTAAAVGKDRLYYLLQTLCATGIRVSELKYITVEALECGKAVIHNKGKVRVILLPKELQELLRKYCSKCGIKSGTVFVTRNGNPVDRSNIWRGMKRLSKAAGVEEQKIFPHNLRHLFAITYYKKEKNIIYLSDIMGHSSVETTRIYTSVDDAEHYERISGMGLVLSEKK